MPAYSLNCEGGNTVTVDPLTDNDWTVTWEDGTVGNTFTATFNPYHDTWLSATFQDPLGCAEFEDSTFVWMGYPVELGDQVPNQTPPTEDFINWFLCPEIPNTFELNSVHAVDWNWTLEFQFGTPSPTNTNFPQADQVTFTSAQILDSAYWYAPLILTGTALNPCTPAGLSYEWEVQVDACDIKIPNIFTPGTAEGSIGKNDYFEIEGLLRYNGAILMVYDRWGTLVFQSDNYDNLWDARETSSGTHFYLLTLPNGKEFSGSVMVQR
jgi:gliding motility-associated-like protein